MKKAFLYSLLFLTIFASEALAKTVDFTFYYPAPIGKYNSVRLLRQPARTELNCDIGTLYTNSDNNSIAYYCASLFPSTSPFSQYQLLPGVWGLNGGTHSLYIVSQWSSPQNEKVGIGTIKPLLKLTLDNDGGILADDGGAALSRLPVEGEGPGTRLLFYPTKLAFRAGFVPGTEWDDANLGESSTAMGHSTIASGSYGTILGGRNNSLTKDYSFIAGGLTNSSVGIGTNIIGGYNNHILSETRYHVVGGSNNNITCTEHGCGILGGANNIINGQRGNTIAGGNTNNIIGINSFIGGGNFNTISTVSEGQTILGGARNITGGLFNTILGGYSNYIYGPWGTIAGGNSNRIAVSSLVGPSAGPGIVSPYAVISGGISNVIYGVTDGSTDISGTISGGRSNTISGNAPTSVGDRNISGGQSNTASGVGSTILSGRSNNVSGTYAIILGGETNRTSGDNTLVAGRNMALDAGASKTFRWGYSANPTSAVNKPDSFLIHSGKIGIRDINPAALLEINANASTTDNYLALTSNPLVATVPGDKLIIKNNGNGTASIGVGVTNPTRPLEFSNGAYVDIAGNFSGPPSSREYKENILELSLPKALQTLSDLKPVRFNYKNDKTEEYVGFIAEDVPALVVNEPREGLTPMDIAAVLNKVIQHQQEILKKQEQKSEMLMKEVAELETRAKKLKYHE